MSVPSKRKRKRAASPPKQQVRPLPSTWLLELHGDLREIGSRFDCAIVSPDTICDCVYFVRSGDTDRVKIGWTEDIKSRLIALQVGNPDKLICEYVLRCKTNYKLEQRLHRTLKDSQVRGEFYDLDCDEVRFIASFLDAESRKSRVNKPVESALDDKHPESPLTEATKRILVQAIRSGQRFPLRLDDVCKCFNMEAKSLQRLLTWYSKGHYYVIRQPKENGQILLSAACFQDLMSRLPGKSCLLAQSFFILAQRVLRTDKTNGGGDATKLEMLEVYESMNIDTYAGLDKRAMILAFLDTFLPVVTSNKDFIVSVHTLARWLGYTRESDLKETLKQNFVGKRDYIVRLRASTGGRPKEDVLLGTACLKELITMSRAENAKQVRNCFREMESAYRCVILQRARQEREKDNTSDHLGSLKQPWRPHPRTLFPMGVCLYVIEIRDDEGAAGKLTYRIGRTKNLNVRFATHYRLIPNCRRVAYYKMVPEHRFMENCIHMALGKLQLPRKLEIDAETFECKLEDSIKAMDACQQAKGEAETIDKPFNFMC